ncbi:MAG: hypothetical protein ACYTGZ_17000 [Planctomycetota bacterium]
MSLKKSEKRCWVVWADAPEGTSMRSANDSFNAFVADEARGLLLFHDHFGDRPGGVAVFAIETDSELAAVKDPGPLAGWSVRPHPLIFSEGALGFLFQIDYSMIGYRKRRLPDLFRDYVASEGGRRNAAREL